jgi:hypothetical protein
MAVGAHRARVFVSYSRKDATIADGLVAELEARGFDAVLDRTDIAPAEDWQARLAGLIRAADAVVFLLSPHSVASSVCGWEVAEAARLDKRLLPVIAAPVPDAAVPEALRRLNFIGIDGDRFEAGIAALEAALTTDLAWVREHTRIGELAAAWAGKGARVTDLLRGPALEAAERWRDTRPREAPALTAEQQAFLAAGRAAATRRQRVTVIGSLAAALVAVSLAGLAWWQRGVAEERRVEAVAAQTLAEQRRVAEAAARAEADQQRGVAEASARRAAERAAVLAAGTAERLGEDGAADAALLLALDGSLAFNDETVPPEFLLPFTRLLDRQSRVETMQYHGTLRVFPAGDTLYVVRDGGGVASGGLFKVNQDGALTPMLDAIVGASPIVALSADEARGEILLVRENGDIAVIDRAGQTLMAESRFPAVRTADDEPLPHVSGQGLSTEHRLLGTQVVIRATNIRRKGVQMGDGDIVYQVFDRASGQHHRLYWSAFRGVDIWSMTADGRVLLHNAVATEGYLIRFGAGAVRTQRVSISAAERASLVNGPCAAPARNAPAVAVMLRKLLDESDSGVAGFRCRVRGGHLIVEVTSDVEVGTDTRLLVPIADPAQAISVRDALVKSGALTRPLSASNLTWVDLDPETETLAVLQNRVLMLITDALQPGRGRGRVVQLPTLPDQPLLIGDTRVVVIEGSVGRLNLLHGRAETVPETRRSMLAPMPVAQAPAPLNAGTCQSIRPNGQQTVRAGTDLTVRFVDRVAGLAPADMTLTGPKGERQVFLPDTARCFQIQRARGELVVTEPDQITVIDLAALAEGATWTDARRETIPMPAVRAAMPVQATGAIHAYTDSGDVVLSWNKIDGVWVSAELFRSEEPFEAVEPDSAAENLLVTYMIGAGNAGGQVFNLRAQRPWFEVGRVSKWHFAYWAEQANVIVQGTSGRAETHYRLPSLSAAREIARGYLTPDCRVAGPEDFRQSRCWPVQFR